MATKTPAATTLDELLDFEGVIAYSGYSSATINRYIKNGLLPAVKAVRDGRRRYFFSPADVDAAFGIQPVLPATEHVSDSTLRTWAQRMAASAPPMRPEQRDVVTAAFTTALSVKGV